MVSSSSLILHFPVVKPFFKAARYAIAHESLSLFSLSILLLFLGAAKPKGGGGEKKEKEKILVALGCKGITLGPRKKEEEGGGNGLRGRVGERKGGKRKRPASKFASLSWLLGKRGWPPTLPACRACMLRWMGRGGGRMSLPGGGKETREAKQTFSSTPFPPSSFLSSPPKLS